MGDQKRWFKVWNSILTDPSFLITPLDNIGRWVLLGALMSLHGKNGVLAIETESLKHLLRIGNDNGDDNKMITLPLKNITFRRDENDNGKIIVTMRNWSKYQKDSTGYERVKRWRERQKDNGVRGDKRREEKRIKEKQVFDETSFPFRLSAYLEKLILGNFPKFKKKNLQIWAKYVDLMIRIDKRNPDDIGKVIKWAQSNDFWKKNLLSTEKLRKQFDTIQAQMGGLH